ncbi:putative amino-acid import ATP-binding protein YxeO [Sporomusa ovata DSM 2662]|uniref:ABC-type polar amino acid transport system, ATPase component n=1 Tax=Sporomusa ovata TaxID=2378 RepID=A0A0U1KWY3_9FIRM|nr:amino acid ABC transporter ATP-binding protein [Sporomusa ovata]EQB27070.1 amino acid ABC transporter ATP-binding protein, PAAT family [Sporomusa ovata DSM 2662]CQR71174.1 ABC-type polar amino acid transport system, ATPase component [Sporomusa ovata]
MIEIKNLYKNFGSTAVLKGINLKLKKGEVVAIIGPSGSGKSTLLRCINFLETPDEGEIIIGATAVNARIATKEGIGQLRKSTAMVFQGYNLFKNKTAIENIMEPLVIVKKLPRQEAEAIARGILEQVGLVDKRDNYPSKLSGGQQQRVGIGRALAVEPDIILLDEPTSALDPELVGEVLDVIKSLADKHMTMLIVTHEMNFARDAADRIVFMDDGRIIEEGRPAEFFANPQNSRTVKFLNQVRVQ